MSYKIIKDKDYLRKPTSPVASIEEGQEIANKLIEVLNSLPHGGVGLSANQIGIQKSVSVIKARKDQPPVILMNPVISQYSQEKLVYLEGCLSLPGKSCNTLRSLKVTVSTMNHANPLPFGPDKEPPTQESLYDDAGVLEAVCVQHEIDHLNGRLMTDDGIKFRKPVQKVVKHGRNDKVVVEKNGETQYIKYKKALELLNDGWKIL
jgi:peptide deformylase